MKAAPFEYIKATSLQHALSVLAQSDDAIVIAGGQTLVPMMAMRLARPTLLIDLNSIAELSGIEVDGKEVRIRAMTRQAVALSSDVVRSNVPLLHKGIAFVGHTQTRNRGTVGGSIAHGDPSAEIPLCATVLDARIDLLSTSGTRSIPIGEFYDGPLNSVRRPDEILSVIRFPAWAGGQIGVGFQEISPRHGDFAVVAVAVQAQFDDEGFCQRICLAVGGASSNPIRAYELESALTGHRIDTALVDRYIDCLDAILTPTDDLHATAEYRRRVARVLTRRAVIEAVSEGRDRS